jgi:hypothetical protein
MRWTTRRRHVLSRQSTEPPGSCRAGLDSERRRLGLPARPPAAAAPSELVGGAAPQIDHASRGHLVEPSEHKGPPYVAEQFIVDREAL